MSITQISRIQIRRGQTKQTNFPQLASGEFGWSIDNQELYIGNGSVDEGAPAVGNTRVLTDKDIQNLFSFFNGSEGVQYSFQNSPVSIARPLQERLDDQVTLDSFIDSTSTDCTVAFQNAVNYLFPNATTNYGPLLIPAKNYVVTGTIFLPPFAEIRGAGIQKSFITNTSGGPIFQTKDLQGNTYGQMGSASYQARNIDINGISFVSTIPSAAPIINLDCVKDTVIDSCEFTGAASSSTSAKAIQLRDTGITGANLTDNIKVTNCSFLNI